MATRDDPHNALPVFDRRELLKLAAVASLGMAGATAAAPTNGSALTAMSARAIAAAIRNRTVSAVEVMTAYLDRIERLNPPVNAIVAMPERAVLLDQALAADRAVARGDALGPLHGLPQAMKDLTAVRGLRYTQGSTIFRDRVATEDALQAERLRQAGAIFIGKTNTPEFGLGSHTFNEVYGVTRNPYDLSRSAGGSSGGAAAALALDLLPVADGSDYAGSLRNPAGWNNVYGFRPSIGRIAAPGRDVWNVGMGVSGPMARNVGDLALLLSVQAGFDARAPLSLEADSDAIREAPSAPLLGTRIAWSGDFGGALPFDPGVLDACGPALADLAGLGATVEEAVPDYPIEAVWQAFVKLRHWQQAAPFLEHYLDPVRRSQLKPEAIYEVEAGLALGAFDITAHSTTRSAWSEAVRRFFERYDYWIMPTAQVFPFPAEWRWPAEVGGRQMATYHEWMEGVCLVTMSGCPALAVPAGFGPSGLPMGIQIIAPVRREIDCLALAARYEQAAAARLDRRPPSA